MMGDIGALEEDRMEDELIADNAGNSLEKSALDETRERITADIYLDINWDVKTIGPKRQLNYVLVGKDAYTSEPVCNVTGLGDPSFAATNAQLLKEAVVMKMPQLKDRLQNHFEKILTMGRLATVQINVSSGSPVNLDSAVEGGNLGRVISKWLTTHAVEHRVQPGKSTENVATYKVRIPLYAGDGLPISTDDFVFQLSDYLAQAPYHIKSRVPNKGLGKAQLIIGGN